MASSQFTNDTIIILFDESLRRNSSRRYTTENNGTDRRSWSRRKKSCRPSLVDRDYYCSVCSRCCSPQYTGLRTQTRLRFYPNQLLSYIGTKPVKNALGQLVPAFLSQLRITPCAHLHIRERDGEINIFLRRDFALVFRSC